MPHTRTDTALPHAEIGCAPGMPDIAIRYSDAKGTTTDRTVQPVGLRSLNDDMTGLVAHCRLRGEIRTFAFDRIVTAHDPETSLPRRSLESDFRRDRRRLLDHRACALLTRELPGPGPEAAGIVTEIDRYLLSMSAEAGAGEGADVTVSLEWLPGTEVGIHVDAPRWTMAMANRGSNHARLAHIARRQGIVAAARRLAQRIAPGAGTATFRIFRSAPFSGAGWR